MCQRLYRPGYSMPELSTPPRRRSTAAAMRDSSAGSNGAAARVIVTPPAVASVLLLGVVVSTVGPLNSRPGDRRRHEKRPPFSRAVASDMAGVTAYRRRHHWRSEKDRIGA